MADLNGKIDDIVRGDDYDVLRDYDNIPLGQTITRAWFTVRESVWSTPVLISKVVTEVVSIDGSIEDNGADGITSLRFALSTTDTMKLAEYYDYVYDIQLETSAGKVYTPEFGYIFTSPRVTSALEPTI